MLLLLLYSLYSVANANNFTFYGSATNLTQGVIQLTPPQQVQAGAVFHTKSVPNSPNLIGFFASFRFQSLAANNSRRGDGLAPIPSAGPVGGSIGIPPNSYALIFNYYTTPGSMKITKTNESLINSFIMDDNWHNCTILHNSTHVKIVFDYFTYWRESPPWWDNWWNNISFGITAATGGSFQTHLIKDDFSYYPIFNETQFPQVSSTISEVAEEENNKVIPIAVGVSVSAIVILIAIAIVIIFIKRRQSSESIEEEIRMEGTENLTISIEIKKQESTAKIEDIEIQQRIGSGQFGDVFRGLWKGSIDVALKKPKDSSKEFQKEAGTLSKLEHRNIVHFFGIYYKSPSEIFLVMEFMNSGSLLALLQINEGAFSLNLLTNMCLQTASGMAYLHQNKIVHRDLALRNVLVNKKDGKLVVKVSDFGMSRQVDDYYTTEKTTDIPIKWSSPEVLKFGRYSMKSDVFSYGVVLWEIFSYGVVPYMGMSNYETAQKVNEGYRMSPPSQMPPKMIELMNSCWKHSPEERPDFSFIYQTLNSAYGGKEELYAFPVNAKPISSEFYGSTFYSSKD